MDLIQSFIIPALPWMGAVGSILGTFMLTSKVQDHRIKGMEIALYGSLCWIAFSVISTNYALLITNAFFLCVYIFGLWNNIENDELDYEIRSCDTCTGCNRGK